MSDELLWPARRLGEAVEGLARRAGLASRRPGMLNPTSGVAEGRTEPGPWIEAAAEWFGCEAESRTPGRDELAELAGGAAPVLLRLTGDGEPRFAAVLKGGRRRVTLLTPGFSLRRVARGWLEDAVLGGVEAELATPLEAALDQAGLEPSRRNRVRRAVVRERLGLMPLAEAWVLRPAPGASPWVHARHAGLVGRLLGFTGVESLHYGLFLLSWWLVGRGALDGRLEIAWLAAWALLLLTLIPLRLLASWWQGRVALSAGRLLRQRLLYGALRLEPEELRHRGAGQLLGSVIESEVVEQLALQGGFTGLVAAIELLLSALVLGAGAGGPAHAALLLAWLAGGVLLSALYLRRRRVWTADRIAMTDSLVERMVGHRTVLAQEAHSEWADDRDLELDGYLRRSGQLDANLSLLTALLSRGWLLVGIAGLVPLFLSGGASRAALAVSLGAVLLAGRSLDRLAASVAQLAGALVAWEQVAAFSEAASRPPLTGSPSTVEPSGDGGGGLEASELAYRYPDREEAVLSGCDLRIAPGDRLLLEGASGGGKSTLAALLLGLRTPRAGLLLLDGLDRATLGERGWRRRVSGAPQFHENHILSDTLAFNLLMGRRWPPTPEDVAEADALCRALALGPLLERMPAGLLQIVGDTGWQLSHGERSRVFVARALLQRPELLVLDESFGALDPETLTSAMRCVQEHARTLLVIAHP